MKRTLCIFIIYVTLGFNNLICSEQLDSTITSCPKIIELKEFYDGQGIIFSEDVYYTKEMIGDKWFAPTITDVIEAEKLFKDSVIIHFRDDSVKMKNVILKLRKHNRQYVGFIDKNKQKIVVLRTLDFSCPESIERFNDFGWKKQLFFSTGSFYVNNVKLFLINLTKSKFEKGSYPLDF